ncbi:MAG TPA: orotidine-5'-phosphate decarboxylase [Candidatus Hydrogenedentes bacterium]|jgi:orotidine-5'-phosphate decarboxylase|nr:MAG: Orotidine 5'-phosphate decarboxylase [Candidatus Hydrogenedentes bacterium ADurb.Bin170]HNZ47299.1 orotidine-5'-phosphate decarboxylase [Candidatus Hydrogenedentota bacterium]HOD95276.1 orotidine-5'-phosphate decarboxylase [Candidatus Hydrogenedentota bacterium]HOH42038.1 orotidine-5'-phosphate decarboxylase [Candidatus Hydrogenedentota bacterium]HOM47162.1 orotidine-5'-phosphate decarboxylase [Candidatus Hydrogenedentota bacterium]
MATELIVVLDMDSRAEALSAVHACGDCKWFKIGAQLFTRLGPDIVKEVQQLGKNVFLDLKYHDIPNTVGHAARAAADLGAGLITVHASGGCAMIEAARTAVEGTATRILAVTVLTSINASVLCEEVGFSETPEEAVRRLASQAVKAGAHGIVCSPLELGITREVLGAEPLIVTPGVRPEWASRDDQARVMTPRAAAQAGASMVVVGRPILKHPYPSEAVSLILEELNS